MSDKFPNSIYNENLKARYQMFDSPAEFAYYLEQRTSRHREGDWAGFNWGQSIDALNNGTKKYVNEAQAIIDKMTVDNLFSMEQPIIESSVVGFAPNIGAYLAGHPMDMYNIVSSENESVITPINIYVDVIVSGGLTHKELIARGVAILGFALALSAIRPVEIFACSICLPSRGITGGTVCRIPSKPIDMERAAFMLCDPAYARRLSFTAIGHQGEGDCDGISWAWNGTPISKDYEKKMRELLGMQPHDVYIPGGWLDDKLMLTNPVQWVKDMLAKHRGDIDE